MSDTQDNEGIRDWEEIAPPKVYPPDFKAGFVAILGKPNVGKSTLVNRLLGYKVAIVSEKPQTTRTRLLAVLTEEKHQIVFVDTPGVHEPVHRLGEYMVRTARQSLEDADAVIYMADASGTPEKEDRQAIEFLAQAKGLPVLLALNKVDLIQQGRVDWLLEEYGKLHEFAGAMGISASQGTGLQELLDWVLARLPYSPPFYPEDEISDQPERAIAAELVREQVLMHTRQEVPHAVAVMVSEYKERSEDQLYIAATIYVEKESQKGIVIGQKGSMLRKIGQNAREQMEHLLEKKVYLDLWVKVRKDWRKRDPALREMGLVPRNR
ncbi:MAG TPA: GTPase Era [Armatimonadota bacterium]|jgi:GTP-binding protein Era